MTGSAPQRHRLSLLRGTALPRWFLLAILLLIVAVIAGGAWFYQSQARQTMDRSERDLEAIAAFKVTQIMAWRAERLGDAWVLREDPFLPESVARWLSRRDELSAHPILQQLHARVAHNEYLDAFLVDPEGRVLLYASAGPEPPWRETSRFLGPDDSQALTAALRDGRPVMTDLHLGPEGVPPHSDLIVPVVLGPEDAPRSIAAVVMRTAAGTFLDPLLQSWPMPSRTAETVLARQEGDSVLVLNDLRFRPQAALRLHLPLQQKELPAVMAVLGRQGPVESTDYRGVRVLAVLRQVPDTRWSLVAKVDLEEALAPWRTRAALIFAAVLGLVLGLAGLVGAVWQAASKAHYRELYRAEAEIARSTRELSRSNADLEQFAYVASHDLQEPLRMISSYLQLLEDRYRGKLDADADEFIEFAVDGAVRLQKLIQDLLAYCRVQTRGQPFTRFDADDALAVARANLATAVDDAGAEITAGPLPTLAGDEGQFIQLLQNLLSNAIKFRSDEPPRIHVSARETATEWTFSVQDNGIGIDPQYHDRIFTIFQRLHGRDEYPGTGIGLAVARRTVERHGGRIWVESAAGRGSVFHFTLPKNSEGHNDEGKKRASARDPAR